MTRRFKCLIAASLAVTGSCLGVICYARPSADTMVSRDAFDSLPKRGDGKVGIIRKASEPAASDSALADEAELVALKPYSPEWWSVRDAIDRTADEQLARKLIICRGCLPSEPNDQMGVIATR
jgi:hypothetical protein